MCIGVDVDVDVDVHVGESPVSPPYFFSYGGHILCAPSPAQVLFAKCMDPPPKAVIDGALQHLLISGLLRLQGGNGR